MQYFKDEMRDKKFTVDAVIEENGKILLIKRKNEPFKDCWALPGGFINPEEKEEEAVKREVKEETGLEIEVIKKLGIYDKKGRDPRGNVTSNAFACKIKEGVLKAGSDSKEVRFFRLEHLPKLAFDHAKILKDYEKRFGNLST